MLMYWRRRRHLSLRDYAFAHAGVEYQEYGQGILRGCGLSVQGEKIAVRPGLLKYGHAEGVWGAAAHPRVVRAGRGTLGGDCPKTRTVIE